MSQPTLRILVVDDNRVVAEALAMLLEAEGHEVAVGLSGRDAIEMAARLEPRVVLLDIGMADMDGFEAARRLRESQPDPARMLLVAVSGYGDEAFTKASRQAGFDVHLTKPVERTRLDALLDGLA